MRTTSDPKTEKIKLRINEGMKNHIQKNANISGISLSEYVRELIKRDMQSKRNT